MNSIIGHEQIQRQFKKAIENKHISHGYIFEGSNGLGKKLMAYHLAQILCCEKQQTEACGQCDACVQIETHNSPDILLIKPDGNSLKREQIDDIQKELMVKPFGHRKIIIIEDADLMTTQAQNTFLKTLEEPPSYAVIIMLVANSHRLLPTILSRSQVIPFYPLHKVVIVSHLQNQYGLDTNQAEVIANYSGGIIGKAIKNCEDLSFQELRKETIDLLEGVIGGELSKVFLMAQFFEKKKEQINDIIEVVHLWVRDIMVLKATGSYDQIVNRDYQSLLYTQTQRVSLEGIREAVTAVETFQEDLRYNVNYLAAVDQLLFKIQEV